MKYSQSDTAVTGLESAVYQLPEVIFLQASQNWKQVNSNVQLAFEDSPIEFDKALSDTIEIT